MKVSEARQKVCPYLSQGLLELNCIVDKCMAWETTYSKNILEEIANCKCGEHYQTNTFDNCPKCGNDASIVKDIEILEGYCKRLEDGRS